MKRTTEMDYELVEHLHHAKRLVSSSSSSTTFAQLRRLGGHDAAAFALWWLEEGSNSGLHFDHAVAAFAVTVL